MHSVSFLTLLKRGAVCAVVGVSISACSQTQQTWEYITGNDRNDQQVVAGPRRPPLMNQQPMSQQAPERLPMAPPAAAPMPAAPERAVPVNTPTTKPQESEGGMWNWMKRNAPDFSDEPAPAEQPYPVLPRGEQYMQLETPPLNLVDSGARKPVASNPTAAPKPVNIAALPVVEMKAPPAPSSAEILVAQAGTMPQPTQSPVMSDVPTLSPAAGVPAKAPAQEEDDTFSFLPDVGSWFSSNDGREKTAAEKAPFPQLSGVPEKPTGLDDTKNQAPERAQMLMLEKQRAADAKVQLESEPSGLDANMPAGNMPLAPLPPMAAPADVKEGEELLGHASSTGIVTKQAAPRVAPLPPAPPVAKMQAPSPAPARLDMPPFEADMVEKAASVEPRKPLFVDTLPPAPPPPPPPPAEMKAAPYYIPPPPPKMAAPMPAPVQMPAPAPMMQQEIVTELPPLPPVAMSPAASSGDVVYFNDAPVTAQAAPVATQHRALLPESRYNARRAAAAAR